MKIASGESNLYHRPNALIIQSHAPIAAVLIRDDGSEVEEEALLSLVL